MNQDILYSIIIPTYNCSDLLRRSVNSVITQIYTKWELIIVDDGSTDQTGIIIKSFSDKRIKYLKQENQGVCVARNNGNKNAIGSYLVFLDSDDYVADTWLQDFHEIILKEDPDLVLCNIKEYDKKYNKTKIIDSRLCYSKNKILGITIPGSFCVRRDIFNRIGGYDENISFGENTELGIRLFQFIKSVDYTDSVSLIYEPSINGGGRNLRNKIYSNLYCVNKHKYFFEKNKSLKLRYFKIAGIAAIRIRSYKEARNILYKSWKMKPLQISLLIRFAITYFPFIAKKIWSN